jgi:hypothetical protein
LGKVGHIPIDFWCDGREFIAPEEQMEPKIVSSTALALVLMVGLAHAQAAPTKPPSSTPQIVDTNGKVLGPLGFSDSIAQGAIINTTDYVGANVSFGNVWILVPWGPNGLGYELPAGKQLNSGQPGMPGAQLFFVGNNCQGVLYIVAPPSLSKNSATTPYAATMGSGDVVFFPIGTPKLLSLA